VTRKKRTSAKTARVVHQSPKPGKVRRAGSKVNLKLG
jgi:beta-lactam-binding protein with PASTA domain